ncbi:MAG TPA: hypothetical protein VE959_10680 [Bryobacteraceae bacterium]|nr:hypothetical protein [Bryobacteraceae bacterium]
MIEQTAFGLVEERADLAPEFFVVATGLSQERIPCRFLPFESGV